LGYSRVSTDSGRKRSMLSRPDLDLPGTPNLNPDRALHFAQAERERAAVVALAADLAVVGVEILVFKGIHLAFAVADAPERRLCLDADVLIVKGSLERAGARIRALPRWSLDDRNVSAHGVTSTETGAYVDLHQRALPPRFGRFDLDALRSRASILPDVFGPHVWVPDALDAAVLAVANYGKDMLGAVGHGRLGEDLALLEERAGITPAALAQRLASHGLRRVGLLALAHLTSYEPRWQSYRDALSHSRAEMAALDLLARSVPAIATKSEALAHLTVRGVADRAPDAAASLALAALRFGRDWWRGDARGR
jgi:hypothetical protein